MQSAADAPARLEVRDLQKSYRNEGPLPVLDGVSLEARAGEFVSVIGPSGCGKSTLFNIVAGIETPDGGTVLVDGVDATGRVDDFAYMPQQDLLFPWRRVLDNTTLGLEIQGVPRAEARARAQALFAPFGLEGFERAYPHALSGGMRQRAALLRTVVQGRRIALLDEPFGALDALTRLDMQQWLAEVWAAFGWTVLLVTHDVREAVLLSDRVYVLAPRPTSVRATVEVDLPRPRSIETIATPAFVEAEARIIDALHGRAPSPSAAGRSAT
ncbi:MAG: ABC transporter ATP-binding protein [Dehalococcoidia bacterium]